MIRGRARVVTAVARSGDRWLLGRSIRRRSPGFDRFFLALTRAADHSRLWLATAAVLTLLDRRGGRRAARRGVVAIALASATVNGPLKRWARRARPARRNLHARVRQPRSFSFPSGHSASAFAFAIAAARELPVAGPVLLPLAGAVAYSRVYLGVHYPSDVALGSAIGAGAAIMAGPLSQRLATRGAPRPPTGPAVLVTSPSAGGMGGLERARRTMARAGITVDAELEVGELPRLLELIATSDGPPRLVIAAGGDGTVGAVADRVANTDAVLGVLPLGTSNDFARSLGIPVNAAKAAALLTGGKVATVDLGRLRAPGQPDRHFAHAATVGLNVSFAKLATRASVRERFGRLTYAAAASLALRRRRAFDCELRYDGTTRQLRLAQLSVINAPVYGGALGMRVGGSNPDDRLLDVLAIEAMPARRTILAAIALVLRARRPVRGVHLLHVASLHVHAEWAVDVALDGEVVANLPCEFDVAGEALRVITPHDFEDIDDTHD